MLEGVKRLYFEFIILPIELRRPELTNLRERFAEIDDQIESCKTSITLTYSELRAITLSEKLKALQNKRRDLVNLARWLVLRRKYVAPLLRQDDPTTEDFRKAYSRELETLGTDLDGFDSLEWLKTRTAAQEHALARIRSLDETLIPD